MSDFNLQKWIDADLEPYADMQLSQCDRRAMQVRAFNKALDVLMAKLNSRPELYFYESHIEQFINELRGVK